MKVHLLVCPSLESARGFPSPQPGHTWVVASDDPRVHRMAEKSGVPWRWLEGEGSLFQVAEDVKEIGNVVNRWFADFPDTGRDVPPHLLFWALHAEGGYTIQRVQDALLLVDAFTELLDEVQPDTILALPQPDLLFEYDVLKACAASRGIPLVARGASRPGMLRARLRRWLRIVLREPYSVLRWAWVGLRFIGRPLPSRPAEVLLQLCSSAEKHTRYMEALLRALEASGRGAGALAWGASSGAARFRREGLRADDLERWVGPGDVLESLQRAMHTRDVARRRRRALTDHPALARRGVPLGTLLWPSIEFTLVAELGWRYRLWTGATRYFRTLAPRMMSFWTVIFPEAVIAWNSVSPEARPRVFFAPGFPYDTFDPYRHRKIPVDLELAIGEKHRRILEADDYPSSRIAVVGHDRLGPAAQFQRRFSQEASRRALGVPSSATRTVLYEAGFLLRGFLSRKEQAEFTAQVLDLARAHPTMFVLVKPHPSHKPGPMDDMIQRAGLSNVAMVEPRSSPLHALNAADLVLTKLSTLGIEAMYMGRPVLSVILDGERGFRFFGDGVEYVFTPQAFRDRMEALLDPGTWADWSAAQLDRAERYLSDLSLRTDRPPADLMAEAINDFLGDLH